MPPGLSMQGGTLQNIPPNASREEQTNALNDVINRLNNLNKTQSFSDGTSKRYIQGYAAGRWPGGDFGVAISKPNDDVTSVDFEDLLFAWDYSTNIQYFNGGTHIYYDSVTGNKVMQQGSLDDGKTGIDWYDPLSEDNFMRAGVQPDGVGAVVVAKPGFEIKDVYGV